MISLVSYSLFINISLENIVLSSDDQYIVIPRGDLEMNLPQALYDYFSKQDKNISDFSVYVLNGPGSFTNLRIGCLCVNMLKELMEIQGKKIHLYHQDKKNLYRILSQKGFLVSTGIMYIGQRKNFWVGDLQSDTMQLKAVDKTNASGFFLGKNFWIDSQGESLNISSAHHLDFRHQEGGLQVIWNNQVFAAPREQLGFEEVDKLMPNYILEPNISV